MHPNGVHKIMVAIYSNLQCSYKFAVPMLDIHNAAGTMQLDDQPIGSEREGEEGCVIGKL